MSLDKATVARIAHLARIRVPEPDQEALVGELNGLLGWVEQLGEVDTKGVEPMAHPLEGEVQRLRPDAVTERDRHEKYQRNAPQVAADLYVVPRVIE